MLYVLVSKVTMINKIKRKHQTTDTKSVGDQTRTLNKMICSTSRCHSLNGIVALFNMEVGNNDSTSGSVRIGKVKRTKGDCANAKANRMLPVTGLENEAWMWEATCASHFETKKRGGVK